MSLKLHFHGAAGQVTGSMYLLEAAGARILLDAGLFQGHRVEAARLNRELPFDPRRLDMVVLSHAHIDHTGRLPLLVREGFHGPIYCTPATRDLCAVATFGVNDGRSGLAEVWIRTGRIELTDTEVRWLGEAPTFEALQIGGASLESIAVLPELLVQPRETWPAGDVAVAPEEITGRARAAGQPRAAA